VNGFRHPLERARNHGAAGSGVDHWWKQRFTSILLVPLMVWLVWSLMLLSGADYAAARAWMSSPWNATMALLLVASMFYHARLGVQVVIEDYVHHRATEVVLQVLVAAAALVGGLVSAVAILKVAFGG
jgi:succinate dehydrogenase / fumarate reductase membrane anchor subunit